MTNKEFQELLAVHPPNLEVKFATGFASPPLYLMSDYTDDKEGILWIDIGDDA